MALFDPLETIRLKTVRRTSGEHRVSGIRFHTKDLGLHGRSPFVWALAYV